MKVLEANRNQKRKKVEKYSSGKLKNKNKQKSINKRLIYFAKNTFSNKARTANIIFNFSFNKYVI